MSTRKRKLVTGKRPAYRLPATPQETEENDLKKNKARILKELDEDRENKKTWYDKELDKNLKNQ